MSAQELDILIKSLRENGPDLNATPQQARAGFETMMEGVPVASDLSFDTVSAGGVPAMWATSPAAKAKNTLLYIHGGAFVVGSATAYKSLHGALGKAAGARTLALDYRLAPEHPFPAAVEDCVTAYRWLLDQGTPASSIVIAGDSAGGGLTISTLVEIVKAGLPVPAAGLAISPWVDLEVIGESATTKAAEDPSLESAGLIHMGQTYLAGASPRDPRAAPLYADLAGLPPLLIQVGSAEILLDDATRLAARAGAAGVKTRLDIWPHMPHVWHIFSFMLSEGRDAIADAGAFLAAHFA